MGSAVIGASLYSAPLDAAAPAAATCQAVVGGNTLSRPAHPLGTGLYEDYMLHSFYETVALIAMQNDRMAEADADLYAQALDLAAHVEGHSEGLTDMDPDGRFAELAIDRTGRQLKSRSASCIHQRMFGTPRLT